MRAGVAILACGLVATACVKPPPRTEPEFGVELPDAWTAAPADAGAPPAGWWQQFDDPSLDAVMQLAFEGNWDLAAALARVDRFEALARIQGADLEPRVDAVLRGDRARQVFTGFDFGGSDVFSTTSSRVGISIDAAWEIDLWGRLRAATRSAIADLQASEADVRGVKLSIAAQTARGWFALAEVEEQITLARSSAESFRVTADQIRRRYQMGIRPAVDLRLALSNLDAAEAALEARRAERELLLRRLEVLVGRYPNGTLTHEHPIQRLPDIPPPIPTGLPAELVRRRPDLVAAERRLAAAEQDVLSARRALYPRLSLTTSGGSASNQLRDLVDGDFSVWNLAVNLVQPIFQGGRLRANIDLARATSDEAFAFYAGAALQALAEVERTLATEALLANQERALQDAVIQTRAAQRLSEGRYQLGVGDYLTVLASQTRAFEAESALLSTRRRRLDNRIDLHVALGGGFEMEPHMQEDDAS